MLIHLLQTKLPLTPEMRDMVVLVHELDVEYPDDDRPAERIRSTLVVEGEAGGVTAMARSVGLPVVIAVKLLLGGELSLTGSLIPTHPAIYAPILQRIERQDCASRRAGRRSRIPEGGDIDAHAWRHRAFTQGERTPAADPSGPLRARPSGITDVDPLRARVRRAVRDLRCGAGAPFRRDRRPIRAPGKKPRRALPKPLPEDLQELREGGILWGWPHCVQQREITQIAIDRKLTLIAWEAMFSWNRGVREMHVFDRNNEMAGYCGVIHALGLTGKDGLYGAPVEACVISHGSVSRGAIYALLRRGFRTSGCTPNASPGPCTTRSRAAATGRWSAAGPGTGLDVVQDDGSRAPLIDVLGAADVIVNGILQDTDRPLMFLREGEEARLKPGALIVDVSCDLGMGFPFARPTSFEAPTFAVGASRTTPSITRPATCGRVRRGRSRASWSRS